MYRWNENHSNKLLGLNDGFRSYLFSNCYGYMAFPNQRTIGPKNGQLRFGISEKYSDQNGIDITLLTRYQNVSLSSNFQVTGYKTF